MRRTKIVATVGPATSRPESMHALLAAGADVVRLNAAHAHGRRAHGTRGAGRARPRPRSGRVRRRARRPPRTEDAHRTRRRRRGRARDRQRARAHRRAAVVGDEHRVSTTLPELARWVARRRRHLPRRRRDRAARRARSTATTCVCEVVRGGVLRSRKGMHVPRAEGARRVVHRRRRRRARDGDRDQGRLRRACRSCAGPKTSKPCAPGCPKRGHRPQLVAKIETAVALDHLARHRRRRRRGDGRPRRSRHPGPGPARAADPEGDHPVLQHGRASR